MNGSRETRPLALVIDDEEMVRELLATSLRTAGVEVEMAAGGQEAREIFAQEARRVRLVLLDLSMPDADAGELFDALRTHESDAKFVLVSGYNEDQARVAFGRSGLAAFLKKPFRIDVLVDLVDRLL